MTKPDSIKITDYAVNRLKDRVKSLINRAAGNEEPVNIEYPPAGIAADLAIPCFGYAKSMRKAPPIIAKDLAEKITEINDELIEKAEAVGGYLNITFKKAAFSGEIFSDLTNYKEKYGFSGEGENKNIVIDYSSPNIAKPFSVGNIRSTVIGQAIYNLYKALGYRVIGINHLGDWGTQFGKLIYAYQMWGSEERIKRNPIKELLDLYVQYHRESKENPAIDDDARARFKMLEDGDPEIARIWKWFVSLSLEEFNKIYSRLGIEFDYYQGESFFNDKTADIISMIENSGISERDPEGVLLVKLEDHGITTPMLVQRSDGATLYATRDLAAILYRIKEYKPEKLIYVVGSEQKLHFQQCFKVMEILGFKTDFHHVDFGLVSLKEGKMSTREGRIIFFEDVLEESRQRAQAILAEKRPDLSDEERNEIAEVVGIGAVKFNDLSQSRIKNVVFDWDKMLSFDGDTAPYLQYSYARVRSILRKAQTEPEFIPELLTTKEEIDLIKAISRFPETIKEAAENFAPHTVAQYLLETARIFTAFYQEVPVLKAESRELTSARLGLVKAYSTVIKNGLSLLGINVLERM